MSRMDLSKVEAIEAKRIFSLSLCHKEGMIEYLVVVVERLTVKRANQPGRLQLTVTVREKRIGRQRSSTTHVCS